MTHAQARPAAGYARFLGCDVAKHSVAFHDSLTGKDTTVPNRPRDLARHLRAYGAETLAICEPTGGYEGTLLAVLQTTRIPAHRADAVRAKAFIRSLGRLAKTDPLDARGLARYGQDRHADLALWTPPRAGLRELQALVQRRADLVAMRAAEKNRAQAPSQAARLVARSCKATIALFAKHIAELDRAIEACLDDDPELKRTADVLTGIPGIGKRTAWTLCAHMPELGTLSGKQAAALAGLAPHPNESGGHKGYRRMRGGRAHLRKALFLPALAAAKNPGPLRDFHRRLVARGKKPIVAIGALMRKIVVIANAKLRDANQLQQQS